ncbi:hypothetical protein LEP1GSC016_3445 [Leptospira borgpetersenii serovar Hardjo-bovis str. Sponselee]|uniref:Uncharacterized protein n=2 Tax=Leptospira borgpetersenii TaxID=174 RepID=M6BMI7_LEPBO|nr:hypothetical protein LEP1GSC016_3445 [Leptospira borgpetersenii serovar Hardjo-bovis str. Sponselee]EMK10446.1 hypothetical protein LEP1GSC066_0452 [Leptospira sp. serovar Kenya str. Sh9]EMN14070.1 hypothetical protein LEP1GSC055_0396 [Leptospira borgpetersenii str. Brem 307]EMN17988.1 hypothetical protein LEP1GSC056_0497 [Leptospira borgpetersenii str. Brem 328]
MRAYARTYDFNISVKEISVYDMCKVLKSGLQKSNRLMNEMRSKKG